MAKGSRREKIMKEKAARKANKVEAMKRGETAQVPSKYRERAAARRRGEPMKARPFPSKWQADAERAINKMLAEEKTNREARMNRGLKKEAAHGDADDLAV